MLQLFKITICTMVVKVASNPKAEHPHTMVNSAGPVHHDDPCSGETNDLKECLLRLEFHSFPSSR